MRSWQKYVPTLSLCPQRPLLKNITQRRYQDPQTVGISQECQKSHQFCCCDHSQNSARTPRTGVETLELPDCMITCQQAPSSESRLIHHLGLKFKSKWGPHCLKSSPWNRKTIANLVQSKSFQAFLFSYPIKDFQQHKHMILISGMFLPVDRTASRDQLAVLNVGLWPIPPFFLQLQKMGYCSKHLLILQFHNFVLNLPIFLWLYK